MWVAVFKDDIIWTIPEGIEENLKYEKNLDYWSSEASFEINSWAWDIWEVNQKVKLTDEWKVEIELYEMAEVWFESVKKQIESIVGSVQNSIYEILQNPESWEIFFVQEESKWEESSTIKSLWRLKRNISYNPEIKKFIKDKKLNTDSFIKMFSFSITHILEIIDNKEERERQKKLVRYIGRHREKRIGRDELLADFLDSEIEKMEFYDGDNLFEEVEGRINKLIGDFEWKLKPLIEQKYTVKINKVKDLSIISSEEVEILENEYRSIMNLKTQSNERAKSVYSNFDPNYGNTLMYLEFAILREHFNKRNFDKFFNFLKFCITKNTEQKVDTTEELKFKLGLDDLWSMRLILLVTGLFLTTTSKEVPNINLLKKVYGDFCFQMLKERLPFILKRMELLKSTKRMSFLLSTSTGRMPDNLNVEINDSMWLSILYEIFQILVYSTILKGTSEYESLKDMIERVLTENLPEGDSIDKSLVDAFIWWKFQNNVKQLASYYNMYITKKA